MYTIIVLSQCSINWINWYYNIITRFSHSLFTIMNIIIIILAIQIRLPCSWQRLVERNAQFHTVEMLNVTTLFVNRFFLQRTKKKKLSKTDIPFCGSRSSPIPFITNVFPHQILWIINDILGCHSWVFNREIIKKNDLCCMTKILFANTYLVFETK